MVNAHLIFIPFLSIICVMKTWSIAVESERVRVGERFAISFQRTLRIPDDGKVYPLPPSLGLFPVRRATEYRQRLPAGVGGLNEAELERAVFIPMYQREALWLAFEAAAWKPNVVKIGLGKVNALTGAGWNAGLHDSPQDYLVCPDQPWLDGINIGEGVIRQFVAMPLGQGYTLEAQISGQEQFGGLQVRVFEPNADIFPDQPPLPPPVDAMGMMGMGLGMLGLGAPQAQALGMEMGLGAGGQITQKVYPDRYGLETWEQTEYGELFVLIVNSAQYAAITGELPPPTPVSAQTYTEYGFPWFELYDEEKDYLAATQVLTGVKPVAALDQERGLPASEVEEAFDISAEQIKKIDELSERQAPEG